MVRRSLRTDSTVRVVVPEYELAIFSSFEGEDDSEFIFPRSGLNDDSAHHWTMQDKFKHLDMWSPTLELSPRVACDSLGRPMRRCGLCG